MPGSGNQDESYNGEAWTFSPSFCHSGHTSRQPGTPTAARPRICAKAEAVAQKPPICDRDGPGRKHHVSRKPHAEAVYLCSGRPEEAFRTVTNELNGPYPRTLILSYGYDHRRKGACSSKSPILVIRDGEPPGGTGIMRPIPILPLPCFFGAPFVICGIRRSPAQGNSFLIKHEADAGLTAGRKESSRGFRFRAENPISELSYNRLYHRYQQKFLPLWRRLNKSDQLT